MVYIIKESDSSYWVGPNVVGSTNFISASAQGWAAVPVLGGWTLGWALEFKRVGIVL